MAREGGPWVTVALMADGQFPDDQGNQHIRNISNAQLIAEAGRVDLAIYLQIAGASSEVRHRVGIEVEYPNGERNRLGERSIDSITESAETIVQTTVTVPILVRQDGIYWMRIFLDGVLKTELPYQFAIAKPLRTYEA